MAAARRAQAFVRLGAPVGPGAERRSQAAFDRRRLECRSSQRGEPRLPEEDGPALVRELELERRSECNRDGQRAVRLRESPAR